MKNRKAFTLLELLITIAVSSVFLTLLMQSNIAKYKLMKIKSDQPVYSTTALISFMQQDFNNYNLVKIKDSYIELKQNDECSVFWYYDTDSKILDRYVSCLPFSSCQNDCREIKILLQDFYLKKENDNNVYVEVQQANKNFLQYFKVYRPKFTLN